MVRNIVARLWENSKIDTEFLLPDWDEAFLTLCVDHDVVQRSADGYLWQVTNEKALSCRILSSFGLAICSNCSTHSTDRIWSYLIISDHQWSLYCLCRTVSSLSLLGSDFGIAQHGPAWYTHTDSHHQGTGLPPHSGVSRGGRNLGRSACRLSPHTDQQNQHRLAVSSWNNFIAEMPCIAVLVGYGVTCKNGEDQDPTDSDSVGREIEIILKCVFPQNPMDSLPFASVCKSWTLHNSGLVSSERWCPRCNLDGAYSIQSIKWQTVKCRLFQHADSKEFEFFSSLLSCLRSLKLHCLWSDPDQQH